jgi:hypothetical protein
MKMAIFWDVTPCSLVEMMNHHPDDGGSKLLCRPVLSANFDAVIKGVN